MENILQNIEAIRREKRIKQDVVAEGLGIKQPAYSNFINRETDVPYSRILHISNILGVSVVDIITYPEKWAPEAKTCEKCEELRVEIRHLNEYIELLKKQIIKKK